MAFPATPLPVKVDAYLNGQWTDITAGSALGDGVRRDMGIEIDYGRANEYAALSANRARFKLGNSEGHFSMRNPLGDYFGQLGQNTPLRVRIADTTLYPTPTIRSVANATFSGAGGAITKPAGATVGDTLYLFQSSDVVNESAEMADPTGSNSLMAFPWILIGEEVTFSGPNLTTKVWYRRVTADEPSSYILYAQSGSDTVATMVCLQNASMATPVFNSFDQFAPGTTVDTAQTMPGGENDLELRWVAMADATGAANTWTPPVGFTEKSDLQSSTFTTGSLATRDLASKTSTGIHTFTATSAVFDLGHGITLNIMADSVQFCGEVPRWPQQSDPTGTDVHVLVGAAGITQRLTQNAPPVLSQLRRGLAETPHLAYWPCEDGTGAIQLATPDVGVRPGRFNFTGSPVSPGGAPDTLGGSAPLVSMQTGAVLIFDVPNHSLGSGFDGWTVQFLANVSYASAADAVLLQWGTPGGTPAIWQLEFNPSTDDLHIQGIDPTGAIVNTIDLACDFFGATSAESFFGEWVMITVTCSDVGGGNLTYQIAIQNGDGINDQFTSATDTGTIAPVRRVQVSPLSSELTGSSIGHVLVRALQFSDVNFMNDYPLMGQAREMAVDRLIRLCREAGIPLELHGSNYDSAGNYASSFMGPQGVDTLINLIEECAEVDGGVLVESRDFPGYVYRTRRTLSNQDAAVALTYAAPTSHLSGEFVPVDDDQLIKNSVTVKRRSGSSSATVQTLTGRMSINPPDDPDDPGVGLYADAPTLNLFYDRDADNHAGWRRHRGSIDESRYPEIKLELQRSVFVADSTLTKSVAALVAGKVLSIDDLPSFWTPDLAEQLVEGYHARLGGQEWSYRFNCSPASAWRVFEMDDSELARVDTDGSTTNEVVDTTETSIEVAIAAGYPLWKTTDLTGLYINIGGEKMAVTAIAGAASPQTFTVTRSVNGVVKEHDLGTPVHVWRPAVLSL